MEKKRVNHYFCLKSWNKLDFEPMIEEKYVESPETSSDELDNDPDII